MVKAAVVFANGCEEVEGLTVVDVLRRLGITCDMVGLNSNTINGDHDIQLNCKQVVDDSLLDYDLVAFPGGVTGAENLRDDKQLQNLMVKRQNKGKWNAAMCAAPIALARYGLLDNTDYTCYPGFEKQVEKMAANGRFHEDITVKDDQNKILTSRGPATAWAYAFAIAEILGADTRQIKKATLYDYLAQNI